MRVGSGRGQRRRRKRVARPYSKRDFSWLADVRCLPVRSPILTPFLEALIGAIVWTVANVVYVDLRRKGIHGFTRFAAFWAGTPTTWISFFAVREGQRPSFHPLPDDDDQTLLAEIRHDREARAIPGEAELGGRPDA